MNPNQTSTNSIRRPQAGFVPTVPNSPMRPVASRPTQNSVNYQAPQVTNNAPFSINIPNVIPSNVVGSNVSTGSLMNNFNQYLKTQQDLASRISSNLAPSEQETNARNALLNFDQSYRQGMEKIENKPIAMEFITGQQAALQRQAAIERQGLAETYQALSEDRKAQVDALQNEWDRMSSLFETGVSTLSKQAELDKLQRDAAKLDTSIVTLDNGNTILVDNQSGKIIKSFGGSSSVGGVGGMLGGSSITGVGDLLGVAQSLATSFPQKSQRDLFLAQVNNLAKSGDETALKDFIFKNIVSALPTGEGTKVYNRYLMTKALDGLENTLQEYYDAGGTTNILAGTKQEVLQKLGNVGDPKLYQIGQKIANFVDEVSRYRTGAALTKEEEKFYRRISPSIFRGQEANTAAISGLKSSLYDYVNASVGFALGGQGLDIFLQSSGGIYNPPQNINTGMTGMNQAPAQPPGDDPLGIFN